MEDCTIRAGNFYTEFKNMEALPLSERDRYVSNHWGHEGQHTAGQFLQWFEGFKRSCKDDTHGNWRLSWDEKQFTVLRTPAVQRPVRQIVNQPPVQPPVPTPQQLQQQKMKEECDQAESRYYQILVIDSETKRQDMGRKINIPGTSTETTRRIDNELGDLIQSMRNSRAQWQQEKSRCLQVSGWHPTRLVGSTDEHTFFRTDCKTRSGNYAGWFTNLMQHQSESGKDRFLTSHQQYPYHQFVANWQGLEQQCAQDVPGWITPASTRTAYEQQASTPR